MTPLCVDLDGTLIRGDVSLLALGKFLRQNPLNILTVLCWLVNGGRAKLKQKLALEIPLNVEDLDYNEEFLDFLRERKKKGHPLFLATACDAVYAEKIAEFLGIFSGVFASDGKINLRASAKAAALVIIFGRQGFSYAGNSLDDLAVWNCCSECILVNPSFLVGQIMKNRCSLIFRI
ncbi:MAG: haloacid dehalogenase-like hydrolase [Holosporaceae bacterium]|jgi:phosphoserine phosphatase|nr:haloacid dehalogenase-like hydrolase [Holosporaceae bacterium]